MLVCFAIFVAMYIETVPNRNSPPCILLRESFRQEGKVKHRTLANLTDWPKHIIAGLRSLLKGHQPSATISSDSFRITRPCPMAMSGPCSGWLALLGWIDSWVQSSPQ